MNINFGPISFSLSYFSVWGTIMMSVFFYFGTQILSSYLLDNGTIVLLAIGLFICYFTGGLLFWFYTRKASVFRNELTIRNPLWFKNHQFYGKDVLEYGIMMEQAKYHQYELWRLVLKNREPIDIAPDFYGDFEVVEKFLKDNKVKFSKTRPFDKLKAKRKQFAKKMEEVQMIGLVILFFVLMSWWFSVVFQ